MQLTAQKSGEPELRSLCDFKEYPPETCVNVCECTLACYLAELVVSSQVLSVFAAGFGAQ